MTRQILLPLFLATFGWLLPGSPAASGRQWAAPPPIRQNEQAATETGHLVLIKDFQFHPDVISVKVGEIIEWRNGDFVAHWVSAADNSFDSGKIKAGNSWKFMPRNAGSFDYFCPLHPNMRGRLVVQ